MTPKRLALVALVVAAVAVGLPPSRSVEAEPDECHRSGGDPCGKAIANATRCQPFQTQARSFARRPSCPRS